MTDALAINLDAPCWLFVGAKNATGYGQIKRDKKQWQAHRYFWTLMRGPIPEGMTLDHLCRVHHCVNPQHLEVVTVKENILRGTSRSALYAKATHCVHGHPLDPLNTYVWRGHRLCRTCRNVHSDRYKAKKRDQ